MPLQPLHVSVSSIWLVHDAWSEAYIGTRRLIYDILPATVAQQSAEDGAMCKLALIGANHMMEVALFGLLKPYVGQSISSAQYKDTNYAAAMKSLVEPVSGTPLDLSVEPYLSTDRLRRRRNETIHSSSKVATVAMSRCALFSAVQGTRALFSHFGVSFRYDEVLKKYPLYPELPFSGVPYPGP